LNYNINDSLHSPSRRAGGTIGRNSDMIDFKKDPVVASGSSNRQNWLPLLDAFRTPGNTNLLSNYNHLI